MKSVGELDTSNGHILEMWTVYDHPSDYPDVFVARRWIIAKSGERPSGETRVSETLDELRRSFIAEGLVCITRSPGDDPKIVETWL